MIPIALHRYIIVFIISFNLFKLFVSCVNAYKQREPTDLNNDKMSRSTWKPFCNSAYLLEATIKNKWPSLTFITVSFFVHCVAITFFR